ncbi:MAG: 16S rRNA (cytosine(1402)-N(4))-methyltransferase RsmH [Phycisphaerae bacterium]
MAAESGQKPGHEPVLLEPVLDLLQPQGRKILVDCTLGLAGHGRALLEAAGPEATLIGLDVDETNLRRSRETLDRFGGRARLFIANFSQLPEVLAEAGAAAADLVLADLGVCSSQLDDPARGLTFQQDGPLDMRLDPEGPTTAAELVNRTEEAELADTIYQYGQERFSRRIARAIVRARQDEPIRTTGRLAEIVRRAYPPQARRSRKGVDPATRTFQALRIAVNDEMQHLERLLTALPGCLETGGRAGIISFHSLEDGRVKRAFADWAASGNARILTKKPIVAEQTELQRNPRSRSAKLRVIQRVA